MVESDNIPVCRCCMADIARLIGHDMGSMLARCLYTIMTGGTGTRYYPTMIKAHLIPGFSRGMAAVTLRCSLDMLGMFTRLNNAVMTG